MESGDEEASWSCPLEHSHDRFAEAHYFLHRMEIVYHSPHEFRYNLNAFLAALRATHEILRMELERLGHATWWKERSELFRKDEVLARFRHGRNLVLHRRSIFSGSHLEQGMFRGLSLRLSFGVTTASDEPTANVLRRIVPILTGTFIDEEHAEPGEQLGVRRLYNIAELSESEDALRASTRALARTTRVLSDAHEAIGAIHEYTADEDVVIEGRIDAITTLLETDLDPSLVDRWGW